MTPKIVGSELPAQNEFLLGIIDWYINRRKEGRSDNNAQLGVTFNELVRPFMKRYDVDEMSAIVAINGLLEDERIILVKRKLIEREGRMVSTRLDWQNLQFFKIPWEVGEFGGLHLYRFYLTARVPRSLQSLVDQMKRDNDIIRELSHPKPAVVGDASA